ncbi:MAG: TIGR03560 family F420-dependent LLM class oxidoreductase [Candidatus Binatia bacterium]
MSRRGFVKGMGAAAAAATLAGYLPGPRSTRAVARDGGKLHFGVHTHPQNTTYADVARAWEDADELGLDSAFVFDHFMPIRSDPNGPCLEGWTLLSALATRTKRVKVGVLVTGNTYRFPAVLAKMAATVDHLSNGRLILGMGAGWFELEHTAYGIPFYTAGERARRLVEAVEVVKRLMTQETTTYAGKYYQLKDAPFAPKTVQRPHPPILIGGMGPKVIQPLAARHADIWHFFPGDDPDAVKRLCDAFDAICHKVGRDPAAVEKSISVRAEDVAGKPAKEVRERLGALAKAGVGYFILSLSPPFDLKALRTFAKDVVPGMREA